jgi:proline dehydrogenase
LSREGPEDEDISSRQQNFNFDVQNYIVSRHDEDHMHLQLSLNLINQNPLDSTVTAVRHKLMTVPRAPTAPMLFCN